MPTAKRFVCVYRRKESMYYKNHIDRLTISDKLSISRCRQFSLKQIYLGSMNLTGRYKTTRVHLCQPEQNLCTNYKTSLDFDPRRRAGVYFEKYVDIFFHVIIRVLQNESKEHNRYRSENIVPNPNIN